MSLMIVFVTVYNVLTILEVKQWQKICTTTVLTIILAIGLIVADKKIKDPWNEGFCPDCGVHWELRAATRDYKYYVCPECKAEIKK